ncbi:MAG TPA: hypothetical protein GX747_01545 [Tenericutes bacterium]|mgnify:CR=1 FL=1|nr:hypothetical protein [Mycoplasmatota bacterium]
MKKKKIILIIIAVLLGVFIIDFSLMLIFKTRPLFAVSFNTYKDGGSKEYYGIGYKALKCNTLSGDKSLKIGTYRLKYSCNNRLTITKPKDFDIVGDTICIGTPAEFYKDNKYKYLSYCALPEIKFIDGTKMNIKDALNQKLVTIDQFLEKTKQSYIIKEPNFELEFSDGKCRLDRIIGGYNSIENNPFSYDLYSFCLSDIKVNTNNHKYSLREAIISNIIDLEDIVYSMEYASIYGQGTKEIFNDGVIVYRNLKYSLLNCNNHSYYIGKADMSFDENVNFCNALIDFAD